MIDDMVHFASAKISTKSLTPLLLSLCKKKTALAFSLLVLLTKAFTVLKEVAILEKKAHFKHFLANLEPYIDKIYLEFTVECFPRFCFVVKTLAVNVISRMFDISTNELSLFSTQLCF